MKDKNSVVKRIDSKFYKELIEDVNRQRAIKRRKILSSKDITRGITKWKGVVNLKQALIDEW